MRGYGPCVVVRKKGDGTARLNFEVRRNRPPGWSAVIPILVDGKSAVELARLTEAQKAQVERRAENLYRELEEERAKMAASSAGQPKIERSWKALIDLRRQHSSWQELKPASQATYASTQRNIIELFGGDPALAPSVVLESVLDQIVQNRIPSPHKRKKIFRELSILTNKAIREGWRSSALTFTGKTRLPTPRMRVWTPEELRCAVAGANAIGERGLGRLLLTQWEIGQRLQSVRLFRYGLHYRDGCFFYKCVKTHREVRVEILNKTARRILDESYVPGQLMFPRARDGRAFTGVELTKTFTRIRKSIPGFNQKLQLRQLRHTVVLQLALSNCSIPEIASITSHEIQTVHQTLKHYLSANSELAQKAMEKRERRRMDNVEGLRGELIVEATRLIFLGDRQEALVPVPTTERVLDAVH